MSKPHRLITKIDILLHERIATAWTPSIVIMVVIALCANARDSLPLQVSGIQDTVYSTLAGVGATLLGFLVSVVALLSILPGDRPLIRRLREQRVLERAVRQVGRACIAMAFVTAACLAGLVIDHPPSKPAHQASQLGIGAYWIWAGVITVVPAAILLGSSISIVTKAVQLTAKDTPGQT